MLLETRAKKSILVLCTGNSARSIMAEALFANVGSGYFESYSAGSFPAGQVNPYALEQIQHLAMKTPPRSKSWSEFSVEGAPEIDIVVTVCGNAAKEVCPVFSGESQIVHWGLPDPAAIMGSSKDKQQAFSLCFNYFNQKIIELIAELDESEGLDPFPVMQRLSEDFETHSMSVEKGPIYAAV